MLQKVVRYVSYTNLMVAGIGIAVTLIDHEFLMSTIFAISAASSIFFIESLSDNGGSQ